MLAARCLLIPGSLPLALNVDGGGGGGGGAASGFVTANEEVRNFQIISGYTGCGDKRARGGRGAGVIIVIGGGLGGRRGGRGCLSSLRSPVILRVDLETL
ncbi:hypothetical protein Zmor_012625 [Zophobas morio]|uniref:Secreted protein n=1 Tax=Zophobas morio TaxID=2755281 RepID=A0AA38IDX0_9CUCU|nr:hypothetical protein Zmor_012625 [Zophobas morio]